MKTPVLSSIWWSLKTENLHIRLVSDQWYPELRRLSCNPLVFLYPGAMPHFLNVTGFCKMFVCILGCHSEPFVMKRNGHLNTKLNGYL